MYSESEMLSQGELGDDIDADAVSDAAVEGEDEKEREVVIAGRSVGVKGSFCFVPAEEGQKRVALVAVEEEL